MNGAALDTLENSIGGTNPVQGSISPQNLDLVLVNNLPSTSSLSKVVSLSFEMLGWGGGGVTNCHSFLLSNPTLSLSSPLKTMLDAAANDLILNWYCFLVLQHKSCPNNQNNLFEVVKRLLLNILMTWAITKMVSMMTSMVMKMMIMLMSAWSIEAREEEGPWCLLAQSSAVHLPRPA